MRFTLRPLALSLALLLAVSGCSFNLGEPNLPKTELRADLSGAREVPATDSKGEGYFEAVYRPSTKVLEYRINLVAPERSGPAGLAQRPGGAGPERPAGRTHRHSVLRRPFDRERRRDAHRTASP